ncbi:hypothetical protein JCM8202_000223 [Rhodotorula sphaerocarpa]
MPAPRDGRPPLPAEPTSAADLSATLYVSSLPAHTTSDDMHATFSPFGSVTRVSIKSNTSHRTYAHVAFSTSAAARAALEALDGQQPTLVSPMPPPGTFDAQPGPSRGMGIVFARTPEERKGRVSATPGAGPPQATERDGFADPSFGADAGGLFRMSQTPNPTAAAGVKPEPSPSPQKQRRAVARSTQNGDHPLERVGAPGQSLPFRSGTAFPPNAARSDSGNPTRTPMDAPSPMQHAFDTDGIAVHRARLPQAARGDSPAAQKQRRLFLVAQIKRLTAAGDKVVLSSRIEGDEVVVEHMREEEMAESQPAYPTAHGHASGEEPSLPVRPALSTPAGVLSREEDEEDDDIVFQEVPDVKPVLTPREPARPVRPAAAVPNIRPMDGVRNDEAEDVDQLATPEPAADDVRFPLAFLPESRADSKATYATVDTFINEYFRRFDESRSSLESFYTANALLSIKVDTKVPARLLSPALPFSPQWLAVRDKIASTPVAITNAVRLLPAVSHNLDQLSFTARAVPELRVKTRSRAPIMLHVVGRFEEFLEKTMRAFSRTFVIVPRPSQTSGAGGGGFLVHSDQLTVRHAVRDEPASILVREPPFSPASQRQAPVNRAPPAVLPPSPPFNTATPNDTAADAVTEGSRSAAPRSQAVSAQSLGEGRGAGAPAASNPAPAVTAPASGPRSASSSNRPPASRPRSPEPASVGMAPRSPASESSRSEGEAGSAQTSVSLELQRRPLPSAIAAVRSATALGKRAADVEPTETRSRKKRVGKESAEKDAAVRTGNSTEGANGPEAEAAASRMYTAEELRRFVQAEVRAQLARASSSGAGTAVGTEDEGDESMATASDANEGVSDRRRRSTKAAEQAAQEKVVAAAAAAERKRQAKAEAIRVQKEKEKALKAGPPLGTGLGKSDARIVIAGGAQSLLHGFNGASNKLRYMVDTGSSYLAVSHVGDIVEFMPNPASLSTSVRKLHASSSDTYRVDDYAWSDAKDTLVVGYLGVRHGGVVEQPQNGSRLIQDKVAVRPHKAGGVTALTTLPGTGRLRFVTGGEDKQLHIWSRSRSTQQYSTDAIHSNHSSMITSLAYMRERNWLVSSGKDKRLQAYDVEHLTSAWQAILHDPIMTVEPMKSDPFLVLARTASSRDQFAAYDIRRPPTASAVLTFGYDLAPHRSSKGALASTNMGRYFRGAQCDTIFAFPDYSSGVKLWDLRNVRTAQTHLDLKRQDLPDLGRAKVVQAAFRGRTELCLMDTSHVTRVNIRG